MSLRKRAYLGELTTSAAVPAIVRPFAVSRRRRARLIAIDAVADLSARMSKKLKPPKKKRKRDKNSMLRGLM
jgi:hypothetical protein